MPAPRISDGSSYSRSSCCSCTPERAAATHKRQRLHNGPRDLGVDTLEVPREDMAQVLGKAGKTLLKIGKAAGCEVDLLHPTGAVELRGTQESRTRAKRFFRVMTTWRRGFVQPKEELAAGDCTAVKVPFEAVGIVVGTGALYLRKLEEQFNVLVLMGAEPNPERHDRSHQTVLILGDRRERRGAQLTVMSAVETRCPGEYTAATHACGRTYDEEDADGNWGTCTTQLADNDIPFALGKKGLTRKKLERSSNCIVQFVHQTVFISGFAADRARAKEYMEWYFAQREGPVGVDAEGRADVTVLDVPDLAVASVNGPRRDSLIHVDDEWGVMTFFKTRQPRDCGTTHRLLIFGPARSRVGAMLEVMRLTERTVPGHFSRGVTSKTSDERKLDTERMLLSQKELPRLLGKQSSILRLLAAASGAVLQYVGNVCWVAGSLEERRRCLDYVGWVRDQPLGRLTIDTRDRSDVSEVYLPAKVAKVVVGSHCEELRRLEQEVQCLCVLAYDHQGGRRLCIFSHKRGNRFDETGRTRAERVVNELIHEKLRALSTSNVWDNDGDDNKDGHGDGVSANCGGHDYDDDDSRSESPWDKVDWDS